MSQKHYNLVMADPLIEAMVLRILKTMQPERIILFGSRARDEPRTGSDYDLLVIQHSDLPRHRRSIPLYRALADLPAEVDVIVYTPEEVHNWSAVPAAFVTTAIREGRIIYERPG